MNLPIKEQKTTVAEYHKLQLLSNSALKTFIESKLKYYKKFVLGEIEIEEQSYDLTVGALVDCLLFTKDRFDEMFVVPTCKEPVGQMLDFCNALYRKTLYYTVEGIVTKDMDIILQEVYQEITSDLNKPKFKGKSFEKVVELFQKDGEEYYEELRRNTGKILINLHTLDKAERAVEMLKTNFVTRELFSEREGIEVFQQEAIEFEYMGVKMKCLPDHFEVDHEKEVIRLYDLKCTWQIEDFGYNYLKRRYDIQGALYRIGLDEWKKSNKFESYKVEPMRFIICDPTCTMNPLIYETTEEDYKKALDGFSINGRTYVGINEAIADLKWAYDTGNWNISRGAFSKQGKLPLNIKYD